MANPYRSQAKSTSASKFKAMTGKSSGGKPFDGSPENSDKMAKSYKSTKTSGADVSPSGKSATKRLDKYERGGRLVRVEDLVNPDPKADIDYRRESGQRPVEPVKKARGGAVGKKGTNVTINVVSLPKEEKSGGDNPLAALAALGAAAGPPGGPPPGGPMGGPMGGPPPMAPPPPGPMPGPGGPMMRKAGGRVHMTAGAETGEGRLQKASASKRG